MVDYVGYANSQALAYGVPPQLFHDLIQAESGFDPNVPNSSAGAVGIAQILPSTAANPGFGVSPVNPTNPFSSLTFAAQYLKALYDKFGNWTQATLGYQTGPGNAAQNPGNTPYPGNGAIQSDLQYLSGNPNAVPSGTTDTGTTNNSPDSSGCSGWLTTPGACGSELLAKAGYIILGLVVIALGLWMLGK